MIILPALSVTVAWIDGKSKTTTSVAHRTSSESAAAVETAAAALTAALAAASNAIITGYTAEWSIHLSDMWPGAGTTANYGATLIFSTAVTGEYVMVDVLGVPVTYIGTDGMIDITNANIASIGATIIDSGYCNPFGSIATALVAAIPTFTP